jgi:hypothetical protein
VVSRDHLPHLVANALDDPGCLMTENRRKRRGQLAVSARNVGVADADRDNPNEHVCVLEIREFDIFDAERAVRAVRDGS